MTDYRTLERQLVDAIGLERRPVAVTTRREPPAGVARLKGSQPSGCSFWRLASGGQVFYTEAADHANCPVGAYTHNLPLPPERAGDLEQTLSFMQDIGYIRGEEVASIPRLPQTPGVIVYAPLGETPFPPDVVLVIANPGRLMVLQEAVQHAGIRSQAGMLGRPTCMAVPAAMASGAVISTACIGNRVYTDLAESELYMVVPGNEVERVVESLKVVVAANHQLLEYHRGRRQQLATQ